MKPRVMSLVIFTSTVGLLMAPEKISINPYDQVPFHRKLIDKKNSKVGIFDLGNHVLIIGLILIVIFVSLNVE